jgi:hypothetical protein
MIWAVVSESRTSMVMDPAMPAKLPAAPLAARAKRFSLDRATTATPTISCVRKALPVRNEPSAGSCAPEGRPVRTPGPLPLASTCAPPPITASVRLVMTTTTNAPRAADAGDAHADGAGDGVQLRVVLGEHQHAAVRGDADVAGDDRFRRDVDDDDGERAADAAGCADGDTPRRRSRARRWRARPPRRRRSP